MGGYGQGVVHVLFRSPLCEVVSESYDISFKISKAKNSVYTQQIVGKFGVKDGADVNAHCLNVQPELPNHSKKSEIQPVKV